MRIDIDFAFEHRYTCDVLDELPGTAAPRRTFPDDQRSGQDGVMLRVEPEAGDSWIGVFAFGAFDKPGTTRVLAMPDPQRLCVVAKGAGYLVTGANPDAWEAVKAIPLVDVRALPDAGLVVFANYTELVAYGADGIAWRTKRLAWDGFKIVAVAERTLVGEYYDFREDAMQRFEVDLATGAARAGVET